MHATLTRRLQASPSDTREQHSAPKPAGPASPDELTDQCRQCLLALQPRPLPTFARVLPSKMVQREGKENDGSALVDLPESGQNGEQTEMS